MITIHLPLKRDTNIEINCFMENNQQQILSEIKSLMASVRMQLEELDAKMAQLQQMYEPQDLEPEPIDLSFDDFPFIMNTAAPVPEDMPVEDTVVDELPVENPAGHADEEPVVCVETVDEHSDEDAAEEESVFALFEEDLPEDSVSKPEEDKHKPAAVIDVMATRHAWRSDMPGTSVKDIRAAIALVDRALFINSLFGEDAMSFLDTLNHINQMTSLDEAVSYLAQAHPEWDFDSDVVYRFMMAVRRKIN